MKHNLFGAALVATALSGALGNGTLAADGRIPIYQPITITQNGSYVVTRDFAIASGSAITIAPNIAVSIDFAGHTITSTSASNVVQLNRAFAASPCGSVRLTNGAIVGAGAGVGGVGVVSCASDVLIDHMVFDHAGVELYDLRPTVRESHFFNSTLNAHGDRAPAVASVEDSLFDHSDLLVSGERGAQIRHNSIYSGAIKAQVADTQVPFNSLIDGNTADSIQLGMTFNAGGSAAIVTGNTVRAGIQVYYFAGARIAENVVTGTSSTSGIFLESTTNSLVEGNRVWNCGNGIEFDSGSSNNVYRNNVLRGNVTPVLDSGTNDTNAGGNVN